MGLDVFISIGRATHSVYEVVPISIIMNVTSKQLSTELCENRTDP